MTTAAAEDLDRRTTVLESSLRTFARFGYRKTSMEQIARDANISRPGLYFLFRSKEELFRAAVIQTLERDVAAAEAVLADDRPVADRLLDAFDHWTGRYIGPLSRDITTVIDDNPEFLGAITADYPKRFAALVHTAISALDPGRAGQLTETLISTSIGIKHQVTDRAEFRRRLTTAITLLLR